MMEKLSTEILIIGGGPGGYAAAIRAGQLGLDVTLVDKRATLGGTCLNVGCIPSKTLLNISHKLHEARHTFEDQGILVDNVRINLQQMMKRKDSVVDELTRGIAYLMKKNNVRVIHGEASFETSHVVNVKKFDGKTVAIHGRRIVVATGSVPAGIPEIEIDEEHVLTSTGVLSLNKVPKHLVVVGGGYIGLELGSLWARLGSAVTILEFSDSIAGTMDRETSQTLQRSLEKQGIVFKLNRRLTQLRKSSKNLRLQAINPKDERGVADIIECDYALISSGRRPNLANLGVEKLNLSLTKQGFIAVNQNYETSIPGVYAIGDVIPGPMLAHKAEEEGIAVVEHFAGLPFHVNYRVIPAVIFTQPEVASVGFTEEQLKMNGISYKVGKFPFSANSRAKANGSYEGFTKVLADSSSDKVLGVHIIGEMAGTMIAEAAAVMEFGGSSEDFARICHAHPTHSEGLKEAGWATFAKALHI
jgi:dihydrolipoamide dehydrogenase